MSLAPASSRGVFLKARLAVNGIQCAARSLGTLTAAGLGLLSSMGASCKFWGGRRLSTGKLSASSRDGNADDPHYFRSIGRFQGGQGGHPARRRSRPERRSLRPCRSIACRGFRSTGCRNSAGSAGGLPGRLFRSRSRCSRAFVSSMVQAISIRPAGTDSAPNLVALVQSSLSVIANAITAPDTILRWGPKIENFSRPGCHRARSRS